MQPRAVRRRRRLRHPLGRAVVVRVSDGAELGTARARLPARRARGRAARRPRRTERPLAPDWALQVPEDYREVLRIAVPAAVAAAGIDPAHVIGIATDFTACTMVPTLADGTPLNEVDGLADRPHAYVKLWKHHAAQPQADRINELAGDARRGLAAALRRADLLGVGVRQGARSCSRRTATSTTGWSAGSRRPTGSCGSSAALRPQRLHRRLQGHPPGRRLPVARLPRRRWRPASAPSSPTSSSTRSASSATAPAA